MINILKLGIEPKTVIISKEKMKWKTKEPKTFPCFSCKGKDEEHKGRYMVKMEKGLVRVNAVVCGECLGLDDEELVSRFL